MSQLQVARFNSNTKTKWFITGKGHTVTHINDNDIGYLFGPIRIRMLKNKQQRRIYSYSTIKVCRAQTKTTLPTNFMFRRDCISSYDLAF